MGGVEELTQRLALHLIAAGHSVEVWTIRHPPELPPTDTIHGITVRRFAMPLPAHKLGQALRFGPGALRALWQTATAGRAFAPDVLHVQCFSANGVYAAALSTLLRIPLVVSLQGETVMDNSDIYDYSASLRAGLRAGLQRADAVTACSQFVLDDAARRFGLSRRDGIVVPNGVELREPTTPTSLELPFARFVFGLGRAVEKKGFDLLIDAFAVLAPGRPELGLLIGGDGPARPGLEARARELGIFERVALPGTLSRPQVAWAMQNAAAFVLPSRVEPFGIVVLEALEAGRPVIVSARGGASEIVRDGEEGLVVDPFDAEALAAAMERLLDDDILRERLIRAGHVRVRDFSWDAIAHRYLRVYDSATGDGHRPGRAAAVRLP